MLMLTLAVVTLSSVVTLSCVAWRSTATFLAGKVGGNDDSALVALAVQQPTCARSTADRPADGIHEHKRSFAGFPELLRLESSRGAGAAGYHHQAYSALPTQAELLPAVGAHSAPGSRRQLDGSALSSEALTYNNSHPLQITIDYSGMDEQLAVPYSSCFHELGWFKWQVELRPEKPSMASHSLTAVAQHY